MADGVELATAWVRLVPSLDGAEGAIADTIAEEASKGGEEAGKAAGGKFTGGFKGQMVALGGMVAAAVAAAGIAAAFNSAISQIDLEGSMRAQLGDTQAAADAAEAASSVYEAGWGESLDQVGADVAAVSKQLSGLGSDADLETVTTQAMALADTFDQDVQGTINAAAQMVKTGLAGNIDEAMDVLATGFQTGANASDDLIDTFVEYGSQFEKLGIDGGTALGLINQGLADGARNGDLVADAIKEFSIRAIDGSTATAEGFAAIGLEAGDMAAAIGEGGPAAEAALQQTLDALRAIEDPVKRDAAAVQLFGTQAEDLGDALFSLDPGAASDGIGEIGGAAEGVTEGAATLEQAWASLTRGIVGTIGEWIAPLVMWMTENQDVVIALAAAVGTVLVAAMAAWTASIIATNIALLASPITWIILGIMALIAGLVLLIMNWDAVVAWLLEVWNGFLTWIGEVMAGFVEWWNGLWAGIGEWIQSVWDGFILWITETWQGFVDWLVGVGDGIATWWNDLWGGIGQFFSDLWDNIVAWAEEKALALVDWIVGAIEDIQSGWESTWNAIGDFLKGIWNTILGWIEGGVNGAIDLINGMIGGLESVTSLVGIELGEIPHVSLPRLAMGATILPRPGGTAAILAEAGKPESVVDTGLMNRALREGLSGTDRGTGGTPITVNVYGAPGMDEATVGNIAAHKIGNILRSA